LVGGSVLVAFLWLLVSIVAWVFVVARAFRASRKWGLGCFFLPIPVAYVFLLTHWRLAWLPVLVMTFTLFEVWHYWHL
jgi:hypothetical protein